MATTKLSILIVEDDPIISYDLKMLLEKHDYKIAAIAHNATKAIDLIGKFDIDLAILDIHLGSGGTGIDVAKVIHSQSKIPYIFLTSFSDETTLSEAQEHGPYGYLVKPFHEETLLSTIKIARANFERLHKKKDTTTFSQPPTPLTEQEVKIVNHLLKGESYQQVADSLFVSVNTVRYHIKNIYTKYDVNGRGELISLLLQT